MTKAENIKRLLAKLRDPVHNAGATVTYYSRTKYISEQGGNEELVYGTGVSITCIFSPMTQVWYFEGPDGKVEGGDAFLQVDETITLTTDDKIVFGDKTYMVKDTFPIYVNGVKVATNANCFLYGRT